MLCYDRIDINEVIDPTTSNRIKKSMICRIGFLFMNSKLKILYIMAAKI